MAKNEMPPKRLIESTIVLTVVLLVISPALIHLQAQGQVSSENNPYLSQTLIPNPQNGTMYIGIYLINYYDFDYVGGGYTFDFYVYFAWVDPTIATADWYLMNGYPVAPGQNVLVKSNYVDVQKREVYRVRAFLSTNPDPTNYPFDTIETPISIELLPTLAGNLTFSWLAEETNIGPDMQIQGWNKPTFTLQTSITEYPFGNNAPRADMLIEQERSRYGAMSTVFPPILFCLVAAVCFLFKMHDEAAFGLRVGIATSMLITAILNNISQQGNLPPTSSITLWGALNLAVLTFLSIVTVVTVLGYVDWMRRQDKKHVERINQVGFVASVTVPVLLFTVLYLIR